MAISLEDFNEKGVEAKRVGFVGEGKTQKLIDLIKAAGDNGSAVSLSECVAELGGDMSVKASVANVANLLYGIRKKAAKGKLAFNVDMKVVDGEKYYAAITKE